MAILEIKAARAWSLAQTAKAFLVKPATVASWLKRSDEEGDAALVQLREPVNKFPDFVRYIVLPRPPLRQGQAEVHRLRQGPTVLV